MPFYKVQITKLEVVEAKKKIKKRHTYVILRWEHGKHKIQNMDWSGRGVIKEMRLERRTKNIYINGKDLRVAWMCI